MVRYTLETQKKENYKIIQKEEEFEGKTTAKNFRGWVQGRINKYAKSKSLEYELFFRGILNAYNHFHPETTLEVEIDSWHGNSSFEIIKKVDSIIIVKYQRKVKGEEPTRMEVEVSNDDMQILETSIRTLWNNEPIDTKEIAEEYARRIGYDWRGWEMFYADRKAHNKLTLMLGALDSMGTIGYKGGKTTLLK